jgi:hypothetical protein
LWGQGLCVGVGGQAFFEPSDHSVELGDFVDPLLTLFPFDLFDLHSDVDLGFELGTGSLGDVEEPSTLLVGFPLDPFGDVAGDRKAGACDLIFEAEVLAFPEIEIEGTAQGSRSFPYFEVFTFHAYPSVDLSLEGRSPVLATGGAHYAPCCA